MKNSDSSVVSSDRYYFLEGGGEMGALMRAKDWSATPLGDPETWPQSLRTMVSVLLNNPFGMYIAWGKEYTQIYNDGYRPILGMSKHPAALGISTTETFKEIWHIIGVMFDEVMKGKAVGFPDFMLPLNRNGFVEDCYFNFSYSPIKKDDGEVGGVLVTVIETTNKKKAEDDLKESKDQLQFAIESSELATWDYNPATNKFTSNNRLKEWFGLKDENEIDLQQAVRSIAEKDKERVASEIQQSLHYAAGGKYDIEFTIIHPITFKERIVRTKGRAWFDENKIGYRLNGTMQDITEQEVARTTLKKNEEQLRIALEGGELGTFDFFPAEGKLLWSAKTKELFGLLPDAAVDIEIYMQALHPDDRNKSNELVLQSSLLQNGGLYDLEYRTIGITDGRLRWIRSKGIATYDVNNNPIRYTGVVQDITKRKQAEESIKESEERFRSLANDMAAFVFTGDADINVEFVNRAWLEFVGLEAEAGMGKAWENVTHPDDLEPMTTAYADAVANQKPYDFEIRQRNASGVYCWVLWKGVPRLTKEGAFNGMIGVGIDISDRKKAEQALHTQQVETERLQRLYEAVTGNTPDLIYIFDLNYRFTYANPALLSMWGKPWEEAIGKNLRENGYELWHAGMHEREIDEIVLTKKTIRGTGSFPHTELGERKYDYIFSPVLNKEGNVEAIAGTARDITEISRAEEELLKREQQMRAMVETAPFPIGVYIDKEMTVQFANQSILDIWGKGNDVFGKSIKQILPELGCQEIFKQLDSVYATGIGYHAKNQQIDIVTDGATSSFYLNYSFTPLADGNGKIYGVMNTAADVTDLNLAKITIQKSEENLRNTILQAPVAMCIFKGEHFIVDLANERMFKLWGKTAKDVMHKPIFEGLPEAKDQGFEAMIQGVYRTGKTFSADGVPITLPRNGVIEQAYVNFVYEPYREPDGSISGILAVAVDVTDQLTASKKIEESEGKFRSIFETMDQGFCIIEMIFDTTNKPVDYRFIETNPVFAKQTGFKNEIGKTMKELVPNIEERWFEMYGEVALTGNAIRFVEGSEAMGRWFEVYAFRLGDQSSKKVGILFTDITEQKKSQEHIEKIASTFKLATESANAGVWSLNIKTQKIEWSDLHKKMWGYDEQFTSLEYTDWHKLILPEDKERAFKKVEEAKDNRSIYDVDYCIHRANDGALRCIRSVGKFYYNDFGEAETLTGISVDITEQKAAEEKIKESDNQFRTFADSIQNLAWIADADGWIFWYNQRWYDYTGITFEEMEGWGWLKVHHPDHKERTAAFIGEAWKKGEAWELTFPLRRYDGAYRWFLTRAYPVKDANGVIDRWIGTNTDITAEKSFSEALEEKVKERTHELYEKNVQLEHTNAELSSFTYIASHDLQEPLRKIQLFSRHIVETEKFSLKTQQNFNRIIAAGERMQNLIVSLLDFSRTSATELVFEPCNLNAIIQESRADLQLSIAEKQAVVEYINLPTINGSYVQLSQLFTNLIDNAIKYSKPNIKPQISITCSIVDGQKTSHPLANQKSYHVIKIADNGIGFEKEYAGKIFEIFQRLHGKHEYSGTGIGLAIVKKIVSNHNGFIITESTPGIGSTFIIYLPA